MLKNVLENLKARILQLTSKTLTTSNVFVKKFHSLIIQAIAFIITTTKKLVQKSSHLFTVVSNSIGTMSFFFAAKFKLLMHEYSQFGTQLLKKSLSSIVRSSTHIAKGCVEFTSRAGSIVLQSTNRSTTALKSFLWIATNTLKNSLLNSHTFLQNTLSTATTIVFRMGVAIAHLSHTLFSNGFEIMKNFSQSILTSIQKTNHRVISAITHSTSWLQLIAENIFTHAKTYVLAFSTIPTRTISFVSTNLSLILGTVSSALISTVESIKNLMAKSKTSLFSTAQVITATSHGNIFIPLKNKALWLSCIPAKIISSMSVAITTLINFFRIQIGNGFEIIKNFSQSILTSIQKTKLEIFSATAHTTSWLQLFMSKFFTHAKMHLLTICAIPAHIISFISISASYILSKITAALTSTAEKINSFVSMTKNSLFSTAQVITSASHGNIFIPLKNKALWLSCIPAKIINSICAATTITLNFFKAFFVQSTQHITQSTTNSIHAAFNIFCAIQSRIINTLKSIQQHITQTINFIKTTTTNTFSTIFAHIHHGASSVKSVFVQIPLKINASLSTAGHSIKNTCSAISKLINYGLTICAEFCSAIYQAVLAATKRVIAGISSLFSAAHQHTTNGVQKSVQALNTAKTTTQNILGAGTGFIFITVPSQVAAYVQSLGTFLANQIKSAYFFMVNGIRFAAKSCQKVISHITQYLQAIAQAAINATVYGKSFLVSSAKSLSTATESTIIAGYQNILSGGRYVIDAITNSFTWILNQTSMLIQLGITLCTKSILALYHGLLFTLSSVWSLFARTILGFFDLTKAGALKTKSAAQKTSAYIAPKAVFVGSLGKHALYGTAGFIFIKVPYSAFFISRYLGVQLHLLTSWIAIQLAQVIKTCNLLITRLVITLSIFINTLLKPVYFVATMTSNLAALVYQSIIQGTQILIQQFKLLPRILAAQIITSQRSIQKYALFATVLYTALTIFTTYHTAIIHPSFEEISRHAPLYPHAIPVDVGFELQSLTPTNALAKGDFGSVNVEGILSYSYDAGSESAHDLDALSLKGCESASLKKISSHINQHQVVTTKQFLTARLRTTPSDSARFPFAPVKSTLTIQNDNLSAKNIMYQGTYTALSLSHNIQDLAGIHLEASTEKKLGYGNRKVTPEINIIFEHKGIATYTILMLYTIILALAFIAIGSLMIPVSRRRIWASLLSLSGLGLTWLASYLQHLIPLMNHLGITLLVCIALSLITLSINLSHRSNEEISHFPGQTRWIFTLLSTLCLFLTLLISL